MNYPVWDIPFLGSGLVVAIIAIIHILIAHLAIGGGAFLFVAEIWAKKQSNGKSIREWLHQYTKYFLIYTTIFGAVTGVGIWFSIQLTNPEATSLLIHQFVFVWAIEWIMFLGELTTLYLYFYGWGKNSQNMQIFLAGAYFVIAWLSLFLINGILTFMLTPDGWTLINTDLMAGFFNPGFLPALFIRTLVMFVLGGIFGIIVATRVKENGEFRKKIINFSAKWIIPAVIAVPFLLFWFWTTLPENTITLIKEGTVGVAGGKLEAITRYFWLAIISGGLILISVIIAVIRPKAVSTVGAIAIFLIAQFGIMGAEFFREMSRKPYVIYDTLYSNGLWKKNISDENYMKSSYLEKARWDSPVVPLSYQHGETIFRLQCVGCHTRDGYRSINTRTAAWSGEFGYRWLSTMHETGVMPPFQGNDEDRAALSAYLISAHGQTTSAREILDKVNMDESKDSLAAPLVQPENNGGAE
jgi:cytochrome d ubiquinol oxidase subunit I